MQASLRRAALLLLGLSAAWSAAVAAQGYPSKPVRYLVAL